MEAVLRLADWQASSEPDDNGAKETRHG